MENLGNPVKGFSAMLRSLPELTEALSDVLPIVLVISLLVFLVFAAYILLNPKIRPLFGMYSDSKLRRLDKIESYILNPDSADKGVLVTLKESRDTYYFKASTEIYAERPLRDFIIQLHSSTSHTIGWSQIKKALPYIALPLNNTSPMRDMTWVDKIDYFLKALGAALLFVLGFLIFVLLVLTEPRSTFVVVGSVLGLALYLSIAGFMLYLNLPYALAKQINKEVHENNLNPKPSELADIENNVVASTSDLPSTQINKKLINE